VAKDVKFFDGPARNRIVAQMNEMVVEANYANAVKGKPFLDALTLVDTNLRFPLDPNNPFAEQDFGFEIVDAPEQSAVQQVVSAPTVDMSSVEGKLNEILSRIAKIPTTASTVTLPTDLTRKADIARVEEKIDKVLSMEIKELATSLEGTEGNIRAIIDEVDERKKIIVEAYAAGMKEIESLILPLLYNLLKNPDKEYIKWSNRTEMVNKQIAKITAVTRKPLEI
jgi:hypothetical protein